MEILLYIPEDLPHILAYKNHLLITTNHHQLPSGLEVPPIQRTEIRTITPVTLPALETLIWIDMTTTILTLPRLHPLQSPYFIPILLLILATWMVHQLKVVTDHPF